MALVSISVSSPARFDAAFGLEGHRGWDQAARQLGLQIAGPLMHGRLHGHTVRVQNVSTVGQLGGSERTNVTCSLDLPMDLGLQVWDRRVVARMVMPPGGQPIRTGDHAIDMRYLVMADEPRRAHALVTGAAHPMLLFTDDGREIFVSDHTVSVAFPARLNDPHGLVQAVHAALGCATTIEQARVSVPPARHLEYHAAAWTTYARSGGLRSMCAPLCMWGGVRGVEVAAYACRKDAHSYRTHVRVSFPQYLNLGLSIRAEEPADKLGWLFGGTDVQFEDRAFDDTFLVKAANPDRARTLLDGHVRACLLAVHHHVAPLTADDEGITVELPQLPPDPSVVPRTVQELSTAVEAIGRNWGMRSRSPYR